ncbi:sodium:sulfate symporter transmembrane region domain-containing protein [Ditylenchus destructor]|nr:sodium:sulfate symporter transmembrane region domain-containing protein [Ditylenchus destructor]
MLLNRRPRISILFGPLWPVRRQIFFLVVPIILILLPAIFQTKQALCAYVVILMGIMWMTEIIPLAATALVPLVLYPLFGVVSAKDISREYLADTNFIFMGSLIMAIAVEITNLHERVALRILLLTGTSPRWLMLGFQLSTCVISMWITNTATAAMMLPILMRVICELERCHRLNKSRLCATNSAVSDLSLVTSDTSSTAEFIPANFTEEELKSSDKAQLNIYKGLLLSVAYTASIGGTGTLVGTAPNLVLSEKINEFGINFDVVKLKVAF